MARPFRFAVQIMNWNDADAIAGAARQAEELGYEEVYSYDHFGTVDPFVPLMVAASGTSTVRVGPLVLNNEFHHPALLARTAATVHRLTGGRLVLGIGTGYAQAEHDAIGNVPLRPPRARVDRFAESLSVLRSLLDEGQASLQGDHHHVAINRLGVDPSSHVPFLIGGYGRRVVELGARYADIFQFTGLSHGPRGEIGIEGFTLEDARRRCEWLADAAGARSNEIERSTLVQYLDVGTTRDAGLEDRLAQSGLPPDVTAGSPFVLIGTVDEVVDKLERQRAELGINHVVIRDPVAFAPVVEALRGR